MATKKKDDDALTTGKKVIAVHTIVRAVRPGENGDPKNNVPAKRPRTQTIEPSTVFMASTDEDDDGVSEYKDLLQRGAVRDWTKEDEKELRRMSTTVGNVEDEEAVAAAASTDASSGSVKTSANAGTTTTGSRATGTGASGKDLI